MLRRFAALKSKAMSLDSRLTPFARDDNTGCSLMAQRLHGIELRRARRRINARDQADSDRKGHREEDEPWRDIPEVFRWDLVALQVDVGADIDDAADRPAEQDAERAAEGAHGTRFDEEELLHVAIARANGLHDADLAAAFEDRHHQRVDDAERSDRDRERAEDAEKHIEDAEEA